MVVLNRHGRLRTNSDRRARAVGDVAHGRGVARPLGAQVGLEGGKRVGTGRGSRLPWLVDLGNRIASNSGFREREVWIRDAIP